MKGRGKDLRRSDARCEYVPLLGIRRLGEDEIGWVRAVWFSSTATRIATFFAGDESLLLAEKVSIT